MQQKWEKGTLDSENSSGEGKKEGHGSLWKQEGVLYSTESTGVSGNSLSYDVWTISLKWMGGEVTEVFKCGSKCDQDCVLENDASV